jgi:hypothetical protein
MSRNHAATAFWRRCIEGRATAWGVEGYSAPDGRRLFFHFEVRG